MLIPFHASLLKQASLQFQMNDEFKQGGRRIGLVSTASLAVHGQQRRKSKSYQALDFQLQLPRF